MLANWLPLQRRTCWWTQAALVEGEGVRVLGGQPQQALDTAPSTTLLALERTIRQRREAAQHAQQGERSSTLKHGRRRLQGAGSGGLACS